MVAKTDTNQRTDLPLASRRFNRLFTGIAFVAVVIGGLGLWTAHTVRQVQINDALVRAIQRNDTPRVLRLLDQGADANTCDETDRTGSVWQRMVEDLKARQQGKPVPYPPVLYMILSFQYSEALKRRAPLYPENTAIVKALLDHGASITTTYQRFPVLVLAAQDGYDATLRLLLERGANPTERYFTGSTPIMHARGACIETLIEHGADPHQGLAAAAGRGDVVGVQTLLQHGADPNATDSGIANKGEPASTTPLMSAASGNAEVVRILLAHGAKIDAQDSTGATPLFLAVRENNPKVVQALLAAGADYTLKNNNGTTPLRWANAGGYLQCATMLRKAGAKN